jgi:hypothetical protein
MCKESFLLIYCIESQEEKMSWILFVQMYMTRVSHHALLDVFGKHAKESRQNTVVSDLYQLGERAAKDFGRFFQMVVWNLWPKKQGRKLLE